FDYGTGQTYGEADTNLISYRKELSAKGKRVGRKGQPVGVTEVVAPRLEAEVDRREEVAPTKEVAEPTKKVKPKAASASLEELKDKVEAGDFDALLEAKGWEKGSAKIAINRKINGKVLAPIQEKILDALEGKVESVAEEKAPGKKAPKKKVLTSKTATEENLVVGAQFRLPGVAESKNVYEITKVDGEYLDVRGVAGNVEGDTDTFTIDDITGAAFKRKDFLGEGLPVERVIDTPSKADIEAVVDIITTKWVNKPEVRVKARLDQLPEHLLEAIDKANAGIPAKGKGTKIAGLYDPLDESVYLIAENIDSLGEARETLFHESLGHYGLNSLLGKQIRPVLNQVYIKYRKEAQVVAAKYGFDVSTERGRRRAAEEVLANIAQENSDLPLLQKVYAIIRKYLKAIGLVKELTDNDIRAMIADAADLVKDGARGLTFTGPPIYHVEADRYANEDLTPIFKRKQKPIEDQTIAENRRIYAPHSDARSVVNRWAKRWFTKEGLLNEETFAEKLKMHGELKVGENDITIQVKALEKQIAKAFGEKKYNKVSIEDKEAVNAYLAGDAANIPKELKADIDHARAMLDELSDGMLQTIKDLENIKREALSEADKEALDKFLDGDEDGRIPVSLQKYWTMYDTIEGHKGTYLNRSYAAFDDPNWVEQVIKKKGVIENAEDFIAKNNPHLTRAEVVGAVGAILESAKETTSFMSMVSKGTKLGSKDVSITRRRKGVPDEIRALLGEYRDPKVNFIRSATKMQWYIANHNFLMGMRRNGMNTFLHEKPTGEFKSEIAGKGSETMNPLNGLYTTPDFKQGLMDSVEQNNGGEIMRFLINWNSKIKYGKAQPLDAIIYTPTGPTTMGGLAIGDEVCGVNGRTTVQGIYPQGSIDTYKISFADGSSTEASGEHLWRVIAQTSQPEYDGVFTTKEIASWSERILRSVAIPVGVAEFDLAPIPLDPYVLGALIGDGCTLYTTPRFSTGDAEMISWIQSGLPDGYIIHHPPKNAPCDYSIKKEEFDHKPNAVTSIFKDLGIWGKTSHHKSIPDIYKYNSYSVRLAVIQGLLDTDGHVVRDGQPSISTASKQLALDIREVAESLGATVLWREKDVKGYATAYELKLRVPDAPNWFRLTRKIEKATVKKKPVKRMFRSIELIGKKECQCIMVDDPSHLYLTDRFIATHNTILSPTTQVRNFMSAGMFAVMNGHTANIDSVKKAFSVAKSDLFTHDKKWQAYLDDLIRRGVLHDNPFAGELKDAVKDFAINGMDPSKTDKWGKKILGWAQKSYAIGDDFWKIIGYESEVASFKKAGLSDAEAKDKAAVRIRDGYPTYSMVPKGIKAIRRWPLIGTFVSFPYEIIRTTRNQFKFIAEDMADPRTKGLAIRRIIGMSMASSMAYSASIASMALMGMDADDDEAIRAQLPDWSRNSQLMYTGYDKDGLPTYIDLGFIDPYTYLKKPLTALASGNNRGIDAKVIDAMQEFLDPFIGTDIGAGTALALITNKKPSGGEVYNEEDVGWKKAIHIADFIRLNVQPGILSNTDKTIKALGGDISRSGKMYSVSDEAWAWAGLRLGTLNLNQSMNYKGYGFRDRKTKASRILNHAIGTAADTSPRKIKSAVSSMIRARHNAYTDMIKLIEGSKKLGVSTSNIVRSLKAAGVSREDITALLRGKVPQWKMKPNFLKAATERALVAAPNMERKKELRVEMRKRRVIVAKALRAEYRKKTI
ncbi:hypothetical protein KAR91_59025, partial [Candidatus Pacearchaeota archaeon]|nr:hypothetical protein [Candidatus Pacearchaeota archaeon]